MCMCRDMHVFVCTLLVLPRASSSFSLISTQNALCSLQMYVIVIVFGVECRGIVAANAVANGKRKQAERQLGVQHAQVAVTFEMYLYLARNDKCGLPGGLICWGQAISSTVDVGRCRSILETGHSKRAACVGFCSRYMNRDRAPACHFRFAWIHRSNYINGSRMHPPWFLVGYFFWSRIIIFRWLFRTAYDPTFWIPPKHDMPVAATASWQDALHYNTVHTKYTLRFSFSQMPCTATNLPRRSSVELFWVASCLCTHEQTYCASKCPLPGWNRSEWLFYTSHLKYDGNSAACT